MPKIHVGMQSTPPNFDKDRVARESAAQLLGRIGLVRQYTVRQHLAPIDMLHPQVKGDDHRP